MANVFIDHLYTPLGTTSNYSATTHFHTLHAKFSPTCNVFTSRCPLVNTPELNYLITAAMFSASLAELDLNCLYRHISSDSLIFVETCSLRRCVATDAVRGSVYRAVPQKRTLITESPLSNGSIRHFINDPFIRFTTERFGTRPETNTTTAQKTVQEKSH
jgi:hypothetical protein